MRGRSVLWVLMGPAVQGLETPTTSESVVCDLLPVMRWPEPAVCLPQEHATGQAQVKEQRKVNHDLSRFGEWTKRALCHGTAHDEFCTFTNPSFNRHEGLSMITTPERFIEVASRPPFAGDDYGQGGGSSWATSPPYHDALVPGKGVGLVASRAIRAGELLMARTPAVMVDGRLLEAKDQGALARLLGRAIEDLPLPHQTHFLNLSTHHLVGNYAEKVYKIFSTNAFRTSLGDNGTDFHATFTGVSRLNHDCRPNCAYHFDHATLTQKVYAVSDILPGEELTVSYIDPLQPRAARQARLLQNWKFRCTCRRCSAEHHLVAESDDRLAQIRDLRRDLYDYSAQSPATPDTAELMITLFELEGMAARLHEAHYRAALEWNGIGEATRAVRSARLCLDHGLVARGPDRPFVRAMRELIRDPERHWSWRLRVKAADGSEF